MTQKELKIFNFIFNNWTHEGDHHKQWMLDQIIRILLEENYETGIQGLQDEFGFTWDEGVAP